MKAVERDPKGGWIARDPATGKELEEGWRWNTREAARDAVWQFQHLPPTRGLPASDGQTLPQQPTPSPIEQEPDK